MGEYIILKKGGESDYEEKKSHFLGKTFVVNSEEDVAVKLEAIRKQYWDAKHNCYAFVIGKNNEITRCSDDREPSGTAGKPILEVLTGSGVHNCLIVVTRYFGGTLLGTGGLVRAYTRAAKDALLDSELVAQKEGIQYSVTTDYNGIGKIQYVAAEVDAQIKDSIYAENVVMKIVVLKENSDAFCKKITEATNGKAIIEKDGEETIEVEIRE